MRAVNTGPSSIIDRDGAFLARTGVVEHGGPTTTMATITIGRRGRSLYALAGGVLTWGAALVAIGWWLGPGLVARVRRRRQA